MAFSPSTFFPTAVASATRKAHDLPLKWHHQFAHSPFRTHRKHPFDRISMKPPPKPLASPSSSPPPNPLLSASSSSDPLIHPQLDLGVKFSSITSPEEFSALLEGALKVDAALLPDSERPRHESILGILKRASKMSNEARTVYFEQIDLHYAPPTELRLRRKEKARKQVERGGWVEDDDWTMEEWDEKRRVKRESFLVKLGDQYEISRLTQFDRRNWTAREMTLLRREARREMEEEEAKEHAESLKRWTT
ncbi:hypothetical protein BDY24DRAFT_116076 [Mrakia frigida]|uniref:uncharacterized protein n=1 Tax=Mrakia frigida TaxID=29902 RepID=UPI003FCC1485